MYKRQVEDGATRPVYYESRVIHLKLDENTLHLIDNEYDIMADNADPYVIEKDVYKRQSLYLYYYFCLEETKQFVRNIAVGATMPSINTKLLGEVEIALPDLNLSLIHI